MHLLTVSPHIVMECFLFFSCTQEKLIDSLSRKINQVYRVCIGDAEVGSLNAVQKLVKVESRLVELSDLIESIPKENVEAIERIKQKERRQKYCDSLLSLLVTGLVASLRESHSTVGRHCTASCGMGMQCRSALSPAPRK